MDGFKNKYVYVAYGARSPYRGPKIFGEKIKKVEPERLTIRAMRDVSHAFPYNEIKLARKWLQETVIPRCLK